METEKLTTAVSQAQQFLQSALHFHQQNQLAQAEALYRKVLAIDPQQSDALHLLGVLASQMGHHGPAEELISQSLKISPNNTEAYLNLAKVYQAQRRFFEAEELLRSALKYNIKIAELHFRIGFFCNAQGKFQQAMENLGHAIALQGNWIEPHLQYGLSLKSLHRYEEALAAFKKALSIEGDNLEALHEVAILSDKTHRIEDATAYYEKAYQKALSSPPTTETYTIMGLASIAQGDPSKAIEHHQNALALLPNDPKLVSNLAEAHKKAGNVEQAEKFYCQSIAINPDLWEVHFNLGGLYWEQGLLHDALAAYLRAFELNPHSTQLMLYMGTVYGELAEFEKAYLYLNKALEMEPENAQAHLALGFIENSQGRIIDSLKHYKRAYLAEGGHAIAHSNYLFAMHYDPSVTPQEIHAESKAWAARYADAIPHRTHANDADATRKLRIGYVSADLWKHPVAVYIEPVLKSHDKSHVEVFCYANQSKCDEVTKRLQSYADHWRNIYGVSDEVVASLIQKDKIDILIDLSGHTAGNRLLVFARKPAPLQATWIGYFNTTGMKAMDYIITDRFLLPPDEEHLYAEKPLRLPTSGAVFAAHDLPIDIAPLPALANGYVTFGCFNALSKLTPAVIEVWAEVLKRAPGSRLYLKNKAFSQEHTCEEYRAKFIKHGVDAERILFSGFSQMKEYLEAYNMVDLGLDPFPYNGATTTLDSLWMGVPMVALKGDRLVSHIGESMLGAVGLEEFIATTKAEYIEKAVAFARDIPRLAEVRSTLRPTLVSAPLTNPALFTRGLEAAFRDIWRVWCQTRTK